MKVKISMHTEQCNVVVIIKYEIKNMKTLEDTISESGLVFGHYTGTLMNTTVESPNKGHFGTNINSSGLSPV